MNVRITKLEQDPRGFWTARVTPDGGDTVTVDNRIGCWTIPVDPSSDRSSNRISRREILPEIAKRLWKRLKAAQRGEAQDETAVEIKPKPGGGFHNTPDTKAIARRMAQAGAAAIKEAA